MFDTIESAADALALVLEDARNTKLFYRFSGLTPALVLSSGLVLSGDLSDIAPKLSALQGTVSYDE